MKRREANFELLRIIAMLMIITLHYLDKGGILPAPQETYTAAGACAFGLEAFCVPAVNVYVLIGSYFLSGSGYRPLRALKLWGETLFYSVGIAACCLLTGLLPLSELTVYRGLSYLFPVIEEHYWFVTAYLLMLLFAPLMNETLRALPVKTYRQGLLLLFLLLSVSKSVLPVKLPTDRLGYDALWFLFLYLIGAYLRCHGETVAGRPSVFIAGYLACSLLIFGSLLAVHAFYDATGSLGDFINREYQYNSVLCLLASLCLFLAFRAARIREGRAARLICGAASASFGVYLLHEHLDIRYLWPVWAGVQSVSKTPLFFLHWFPCILTVYLIGMAVDLLRQKAFYRIGRLADRLRREWGKNR